jgi:hypothetical protein
MHIAKADIPTRLKVPGAVARQLLNFGTPEGPLGAEYFSLAAGTDMAPLLQGLAHDTCHAPHWGYLICGQVEVDYADGRRERCVAGDVFYWPAGHSLRVDSDAELIMFSPQIEHSEVIEHIRSKLAPA